MQLPYRACHACAYRFQLAALPCRRVAICRAVHTGAVWTNWFLPFTPARTTAACLTCTGLPLPLPVLYRRAIYCAATYSLCHLTWRASIRASAGRAPPLAVPPPAYACRLFISRLYPPAYLPSFCAADCVGRTPYCKFCCTHVAWRWVSFPTLRLPTYRGSRALPPPAHHHTTAASSCAAPTASALPFTCCAVFYYACLVPETLDRKTRGLNRCRRTTGTALPTTY